MQDPSRKTPAIENAVRVCCQAHANKPDALLEILHDILERLDCVPDEAIPVVAESLNLSRADVHGVVSFYHDFRRTPAGRHRLRICRAEACQAMGGEALAHLAEHLLGIGAGQTTADGAVTLEAAYCLGNCALSPSVMLDGRLVGRADGERLGDWIARCRKAAP